MSIIAGAPFGFALVVIFQGINNYLGTMRVKTTPAAYMIVLTSLPSIIVDSYTVYAASVLAGTAILRSVFAAAFPLFTARMYENLGIHWASSIPAFLALTFAPFPFLLYKYGPLIRARCKYSAEAQALMKQLQSQSSRPTKHKTIQPVDDDRANELRDDVEVEDGEVEKIVESDRNSKD